MPGNLHQRFLFTVLALAISFGAQQASAQLGTRTVFVDPVNGINSPEQSGGSGAPFASITFAMQQLESAEIDKPWTLRLKAGTYAAPSETFPIVLHTGIQLIGDDDEAPASIIISGAGNTNKNAPLVIAIGATNVALSGITFRDQARTGGSNQGGALELIDFGGRIENSQFIGNSTRKAGGAIWVELAAGERMPMENTLFDGNNVVWSNDFLQSGGAIHVEGDYRGSVTHCRFNANSVVNSIQSTNGQLYAAGGAIYISGGFSGGAFTNSAFTGNELVSGWGQWDNTSSGGAIHIEGSASTAFESCEFSNNSALGANSFGGSIAIGGTFTASDGLGLNNCTFKKNVARTSGGAVSIQGDARLSVNNSSFDENSVLGSGKLRSGGAMHVAGDFVGSIQASDFKTNSNRNSTQSSNGDLYAAGGALYVGGDFSGGVVENSTFSGNILTPGWSQWDNTSRGGAIHVEGDAFTSFDSCEFSNNSALGRHSTGGALSIYGTFHALGSAGFNGSTFKNNVARTSGGAVSIQDAARLSINGSVFDGNIVRGSGGLRSGGAIYVLGEFKGSVIGNTFNANIADNTTQSTNGELYAAGGALYVGGALSGGTFTDNTFTLNELYPYAHGLSSNASSGAAVHIEGAAATSFIGCEFVGNTAYGSYATGGAITIVGTFEGTQDAAIQSCLFAENVAAGPGGAVYADSSWSGAVLDSDFIRNTGKGSQNDELGVTLGGALAVAAGMQGDIKSCLFSDNQLARFYNRVKATGGAVGIGGTYLGSIAHNTFAANLAIGGNDSWSEGGAIGIRGLVQPSSEIHNNLFSKNSANYGGAIYLGADSGVHARLFNNHFLYNQTPSRSTGGAALFTRQNMFVYNNTIFGQAADVAGIALWDLAGGTEIWNNAIINVRTGVHLNSAALTNSVKIAHNNFLNTTDIVLRGSEGLGNQIQAIEIQLGTKFIGNHKDSPLIYGEGGGPDRPSQAGSWKSSAYYDADRDVTVFSDPSQAWTDGQWRNKMLNLSQSATDDNQREHFLITDNTSTEIYIHGNLVPEFEGIVAENRGRLGQTYTIDNYRLSPRSWNIDRGAPVEVFIGGVLSDITPEADYEGDPRPRNCGVDIGADEGLRPASATLTLNGEASICLPVGASFVDPGVTAVYGSGVDIGGLVAFDGSVDTNNPGTYTLTYTIDFCVEPAISVTRTVEVTFTPCAEPTGPQADAGANRPVAPDETGTAILQLDGSGSTGNELSYAWSGVAGAPDPADTVMPTVSLTEGVYTFELTVTDNEGQSDSDQVVITVTSAATAGPIANAGQDRTITAPPNGSISVTLDGRGSTGTGLSFVWTGVGGAPDPADTVMPTVSLTEGVYTFELTVTDNEGQSDTDQVVISVTRASTAGPNADAGDNLTATAGNDGVAIVTLNGTGSTGVGLEFEWTGLNGSPDPVNTVRPEVSLAPGTYQFLLTVTDENSLSDTDIVSVTVLPTGTGTPPVASAIAEVIQEIQATNALAMVLLDGSSSSATEAVLTGYSWVALGGSPDPEDREQVTLELEPGVHTFRLTVTDSNGNTGTTTITVTVNRPTLNMIRQLLQSGFAIADENLDASLSLEEARSIVPYLQSEELDRLDGNLDGELDEAELSKKPTGTTGCSLGTGANDSGVLGDILVVLTVLTLLVGFARLSDRRTKGTLEM